MACPIIVRVLFFGQTDLLDTLLLSTRLLYCFEVDKLTGQAYMQELDGKTGGRQQLHELQCTELQEWFEWQSMVLYVQDFAKTATKEQWKKAGIDIDDLKR